MNGSAGKILVVDDESANLTLVEGILKSLYKVYPVESGEDALEFLEIQRPDLILLDIEMPGMSGRELFNIIKSKPALADIPVIFISGFNDVKSEADVFRIGASDYIRKPINDVIMLARIKMHLEFSLQRKSQAVQ